MWFYLYDIKKENIWFQEGCISSHLVNVQADAKLLTMSAMDYCFDPLFYAKLSHTRVTIRNGVQTISLVNTANALYSCIKSTVLTIISICS